MVYSWSETGDTESGAGWLLHFHRVFGADTHLLRKKLSACAQIQAPK